MRKIKGKIHQLTTDGETNPKPEKETSRQRQSPKAHCLLMKGTRKRCPRKARREKSSTKYRLHIRRKTRRRKHIPEPNGHTPKSKFPKSSNHRLHRSLPTAQRFFSKSRTLLFPRLFTPTKQNENENQIVLDGRLSDTIEGTRDLAFAF